MAPVMGFIPRKRGMWIETTDATGAEYEPITLHPPETGDVD